MWGYAKIKLVPLSGQEVDYLVAGFRRDIPDDLVAAMTISKTAHEFRVVNQVGKNLFNKKICKSWSVFFILQEQQEYKVISRTFVLGPVCKLKPEEEDMALVPESNFIP